MKRSFGGFLTIAGLIMSTYALSAYNLYTASDPTAGFDNQPINPIFYFFFIIAAISVIVGVSLIRTHEKSTE
jgi:hypothetical protein